jgi:hypothetical protein
MGDEKILAQWREMEQARDELFNARYRLQTAERETRHRLQTAEREKDEAQTRFRKAQNVLSTSVQRAEGSR